MSTRARSASASRPKTIIVDALARVEGEGGLTVHAARGQGRPTSSSASTSRRASSRPSCAGRDFREAPDITARICGICPVAYQMSSIHAMEAACGVSVAGPLRALRRLLYCGEWIECHALHVYMLHAPDFLGYESAIHMAADHADVVKKALELKKTGNDLVTLVGGREIHPINVKVGGFYRVPTRRELAPLAERLKRALDLSLEAVRFAASLDFPDFEQDYEFVSLRHPDEYPFNEGRIVSSKGLDIPVSEFEDHFIEEHVAHANALHCVHKGHGAYHVGPLARYSLNFDRLPAVAQEAARAAGLGTTCRNPFKSIVVRAVELVFACHEALRIIDAWEPPDRPPWTSCPAPAPATAPPRRRAACSTTATTSTRRASSSRRRSSRRPRRTRRRSRTTSGTSCRPSSTCRRTSSPGSASRPSATTTPASPARPTS